MRRRFFRPQPVKVVGVRRSLKAAPSVSWSGNRARTKPYPKVELGESLACSGRWPIDGRHLGRSGFRISSRGSGRSGPWPRWCWPARALRCPCLSERTSLRKRFVSPSIGPPTSRKQVVWRSRRPPSSCLFARAGLRGGIVEMFRLATVGRSWVPGSPSGTTTIS